MNKDLDHKELLCIFIVMNLQENIERIHEIMGGVITEDRKEVFIKNMINDIGLGNTIKLVGDYDEVAQYLSDGEKIKFIQDVINDKPLEMGGVGRLSPFDFDEQPIRYTDGDKVNLITDINKNGVKFPNGEGVPFSDIPTDDLDRVFRFAFHYYEKF